MPNPTPTQIMRSTQLDVEAAARAMRLVNRANLNDDEKGILDSAISELDGICRGLCDVVKKQSDHQDESEPNFASAGASVAHATNQLGGLDLAQVDTPTRLTLLQLKNRLAGLDGLATAVFR